MTTPSPRPGAMPQHPHMYPPASPHGYPPASPHGYPPASPHPPPPAGGQPGYGPPTPPPYAGHHPQWGAPSPPGGGRGKTGWIIGAIAVVVAVLIIAIAGAAFLTWRGSGDSGAIGDGDDGEAPPPNAYAAREDICTAVDLSPVEDLSGTAHTLRDDGYEMFSISTWSCRYSMRNDDVWGELQFRAHVFPDVEGAEQEFGRTLDVTRDFFDRVEEAPGPWQEGYTLVKDESDEWVGSVTVASHVQDSNLLVEVRFHGITDPGADMESEFRATVDDMVVNLMTAHAG